MVEETTATWDLPRDLTAGAAARGHVRDFLAPTDPDDVRESCELAASELAVNAIRHGHPPATLRLVRRAHEIRIEVTGGAGLTRPRITPLHSVEPDSPSGRGLAILASIATDLGWSEDDGRITVWADFRRGEISPG